MKGYGVAKIFGFRLFFGFVLAVSAALIWAGAAGAQQSADDQYEPPTAPSGPAAESQCTVPNDTDGVVNAGDRIVCEGNFDVSSGSSVVLQDGDGTQGTFIDGTNANITEGNLLISVTGAPINVSGGNGVLNTEGLFVVATTGVADAGGAGAVASEKGGPLASALLGVLPETGGFMLLGTLAGLALIGAGIMVLRGRLSSQQ